MKVCLSCKAEFAVASWVCPECSWSPTDNGFVMFAPALAESVEHYPSDAIVELAPHEERYFWSVARNEMISELLAREFPHAKSLLEVGCGMGGVLAHLHRKHPHMSLTGADLMPDTLRIARERVPDATLIQADIRHIPYSEEFDVVCALDVIEHIDEDDVALREIARSVRPEGGVVVAVPQHTWLWGAWDDLMHHRRRYTRRSLLELLDAAGLEPVRVTSSFSFVLPLVYLSRLRNRSLDGADPYRVLRIPSTVNRALGLMMRAERSLIRRGVSLPVGSSLTVVSRKRR
jgi:2-polyprenyl-3-methyl-5-hydroxy-6-metoxy-1,4-benzoquinol methylase